MVYEQKDIAPTLAKVLDVEYGVPSGDSIDVYERYVGDKVLLVIIDSFDWSIFERFGREIIKKFFEPFEEFKVSSPAEVTSPGIATILTGLDPEEHGVFSTEDARDSDTVNLPEFLAKKGVKASVVMEAEGANTFLRSLNSVVPVEDTGNILVFDDNILEGVEETIGKFDFIVCHLRTVDEYLHQNKSLKEIRERLEYILKKIYDIGKEKDYVFVLTGDHKAHGDTIEGSEYIPLIFANP